MGKTLQFRCPVCNRLLVKWETGSGECIYKVVEIDSETGKTRCTKCNAPLVFKDNKFVADVDISPVVISSQK